MQPCEHKTVFSEIVLWNGSVIVYFCKKLFTNFAFNSISMGFHCEKYAFKSTINMREKTLLKPIEKNYISSNISSHFYLYLK